MAKKIRAHIDDLMQELRDTGQISEFQIGILHDKETGETRADFVVNLCCRMRVAPGSFVAGQPFDGAEQCGGSLSPVQLKRYIRGALSRKEFLTAAELNNLGYAYACQGQPHYSEAQQAFAEGLRRTNEPAIVACIEANLAVLEHPDPPQRPSKPPWPLMIRPPKIFLQEVRAGKVAGVRMMYQREIEMLKHQRSAED